MLTVSVFHKTFDKSIVIEMKQAPRIGDKMGVFFTPAPVVTDLLWVTSESPERLQGVDVLIEVN